MQGHTSPITHASHTRIDTFVWDEATGWISWQTPDRIHSLPLCWIPIERRGRAFAYHGTTVVMGAKLGIITILDFSDVIAMLGNTDSGPVT
jgi:hypothetical protein